MGDREKASLRLQFNPQIRLELHGATITSDAGLLAFRELDDALDLTPIASDYLQESRTGRNIRRKNYSRDCPDQTDSSNHVTLWDGSNYKRAA